MDAVELGQHAKLIIENKAFDEMFNIVRVNYQNMWASTKPQEGELRERLYNTIVGLTDVKKQIESVATLGDNVAFNKEKEESSDK
jgi:hypothetical protein|tara:strand:+ start:3126 stop:3380 length:255 start_codon:yes stop_codon:yes gene_type:complete